MKNVQRLYQPTPDGNPFYQLALAADFSGIKCIKEIRAAFDEKLAGMVTAIENSNAQTTSITQVTENLYYSAMSAGLLRLKAAYQFASLKHAAPPEQSVANYVMLGFGSETHNPEPDNLRSVRNFNNLEHSVQNGSKSKTSREMDDIFKKAKELGRKMEIAFDYSGKAMRALAMVSIISHVPCKWYNVGYPIGLSDFFPTKCLIWDEGTAYQYPVIGVLCLEDWADSYERTPKREATFWLEGSTDCAFNRAYNRKLAELMSMNEMPPMDRARLEELRNYYFDSMCIAVFGIRGKNFPRVLQLVMAVKAYMGNDVRISENDLFDITPTECDAITGRESILTKDYEGMDGVFYRISDGLKKFAQTVEEFNLLSGYIFALMREVLL